MKLVGALLLVAAACAIGHLQAARREQRVRLLAGLIGAMDLLESHIVYGRTLLAEALWRVGEQRADVGSLFLEAARLMEGGLAFSKAWRKALSAWSWGTALTAGDVRPLRDLGDVLGRSPADDQARLLRWVKSQLHAGWHDAREKLPELTRLYRALGVCGGLILALLLY